MQSANCSFRNLRRWREMALFSRSAWFLRHALGMWEKASLQSLLSSLSASSHTWKPADFIATKKNPKIERKLIDIDKEWKESEWFHSTSKFQVRIEDSASTIKFYELLKRDGYSTSGNVEETLSFADYLNGLRASFYNKSPSPQNNGT